MDKFQALQLFVRVVENKSFSVTAKELALGQATVSKHINELENQLKTKLMARTTRRLHLTEAGEKLYQHAKLILEQYDSAVGEVQNLKQHPTGTLRLATPILLGRKQITPLLSGFCEQYPDIVIEHYLSDLTTDLVRDGIDLSIRIGELKDSTHQARRLGSLTWATVASPAFLKRHGAPKHPSDLKNMPCLIYLRHPTPFDWHYVDTSGTVTLVHVTGAYRVDVFEALCEAALAGMGVLRAPLSACGEDIESGKLVQLFADYQSVPIPVHAVMPSSSYIPQKTRVMIEYLASAFKKNRWLSDTHGGHLEQMPFRLL